MAQNIPRSQEMVNSLYTNIKDMFIRLTKNTDTVYIKNGNSLLNTL